MLGYHEWSFNFFVENVVNDHKKGVKKFKIVFNYYGHIF